MNNLSKFTKRQNRVTIESLFKLESKRREKGIAKETTNDRNPLA